MIPKDLLRAAAAQLLQKTAVGSEELERHVAMAANPAFWLQLVPTGTISTELSVEPSGARSEDQIAAEYKCLESSGYFRLESVLSTVRIARLREIVNTLHVAGWPLVFAALFDDFWAVTREGPIAALLSQALGSGYLQRPDLWAHRVANVSGAKGWKPHADNPEQVRGTLTVWISLTPATVDNSCMFVVPREALSPEQWNTWTTQESLPAAVLAEVTPLPVPSASAIGWHGDVIHWGGPYRKGTQERLSLSTEFVDAHEASLHRGLPLVDPRSAHLPEFPYRLQAVARAITSYASRFQVIPVKFQQIAERILALG